MLKKEIKREWYLNGNIKSQTTFVKNLKDGEERLFYQNSQPKAVNKYKNGKLNGLAIKYYYNGNIKSRVIYKNHKIHGVKQIFNLDGEKVSSESFRHNRKSGSSFYFYPYGLVKMSLTYKNNKKNGISTVYHMDGSIQIQAEYKNGALHGNYKEWDNQGRIKKELIYSRGIMLGKCIEHVYMNKFSSNPIGLEKSTRTEVVSFFHKDGSKNLYFNFFDKDNNLMETRTINENKYIVPHYDNQK